MVGLISFQSQELMLEANVMPPKVNSWAVGIGCRGQGVSLANGRLCESEQ